MGPALLAMAGTWICVLVPLNSAHRQNLVTYATMRGLETNDCGDWICILIPVGPMGAIDQLIIATYAEQNGLPVQMSDTPCPE